MAMIHYRVEAEDLRSHHFRVTLTLADPGPSPTLELALPVWIPGSYLVREFARHLSDLQARQGRRRLGVQPLDKARWQLQGLQPGRPLTLSWRVYAFDTSVRTAFLDEWRGFFNGTGLLLRVVGREDQPHRLQLGRLPAGWEVATAMAPAADGTPLAFDAADYHELVDHPFELGSFWRGRFVARGVPHQLVVSGAAPRFDGDRLLADVQRICEAQMALWHPDEAGQGAAPPFDRYVFLLNVTADGYGGLEHRHSTALLAARRDLPVQGEPAASDAYVGLLGLISHEYFHTWNVKRLKPAEFQRLDYQQENYSQLLWFFEGVTSYYDDLMLRRAGLVDAPRYLKLLARNVNGLRATPGRRVQSVAGASHDAWIKYYRPDENSANASVSYYVKGALVALLLDLGLRRQRSSLDALLRRLWQDSAAGGPAPGDGAITEAQILDATRSLGGEALAAELAAWVHGTAELPLAQRLAEAGIDWRSEHAGLAASLGLKLAESPLTGVQVKSVLEGGAAQRAGVAAGDEILAVDGWRVRRLDEAQAWVGRDQPFELLLVRDQRVLSRRVTPPPRDAEAAQSVALALVERLPRALARRRQDWLDA